MQRAACHPLQQHLIKHLCHMMQKKCEPDWRQKSVMSLTSKSKNSLSLPYFALTGPATLQCAAYKVGST